MVRMSRRRLLRGTAAALGGVLAAACELRAPDTSPGETPGVATAVPPRPLEGVHAPAKPPQKVQVLTWSEWLEEYKDVLPQLAEEFSGRHPSLTVDWQPFPVTYDPDAPSEAQQIEQLHSAGLLFDVMQFLFPHFTSRLFVGDAAVDLLPFIRSDKYDLSDYWPGAIEAMQWERKLYGLHTEVRPTLLHCNEALFAQAGLGVPTTAWTWPQLRAATKQLTDRQRPKPVFGFGLDTQVFYTLPWIWANGGAMLSADRSESLVARPESQEALQWLHDLSLTQAFGLWEADFSPANDINVVELFLEGRVAMLYGLWINQSAFTEALGRTPQFSFAPAEPPRGSRQSASLLGPLGASNLSKSARVPDDGWRFLSWWTSEATQRRFQAAGQNGFMAPPARRSLAGEFVDRYGTATLAALAYARPLPLHPKSNDLVKAYDQGLVPMWKGEQTVAEATAAIAREQNAILAEWRRKQQQGTP